MKRAVAALCLLLSCQPTSDTPGGPMDPGQSIDPCTGNPLMPTESGRTIFAKRFGAAGGDRPKSISVGADGSVLLSGQFANTVDFGGTMLTSTTGFSSFIARYSPSGDLLWAKRPAVSGEPSIARAHFDSTGGVVIVGQFSGTVDFGGGPITASSSGDLFVARYTADGAYVWARNYVGGSSRGVYGLAVDAENIVMFGEFQGSITFGSQMLTSQGLQDIFVISHALDGTPRWSHSWGSVGTDRAVGGMLQGGELWMTCQFGGTVDFGAGPVSAVGALDLILLTLNKDGQLRTAHRSGGSGYDAPNNTPAVDRCGNATLTGYFMNQTDLGGGPLIGKTPTNGFLVRYAGDGSHVYSRLIDGYGALGNNTALAPDNSVLLIGSYHASVNLGSTMLQGAGKADIFVTRMTPDGSHLWARGFGGSGDDSADPIAVAADGSVLVAGQFQNMVDFGGTTLTSAGDDDIFLLKLAP